MGSLKTLLLACLVLVGVPARAEPLEAVFAACTGRFSAELEHAWLVGHADPDGLEHRRDQFEALTAAAASAQDRVILMDRRIRAKAAHKRMLHLAAFARDPAQAAAATRRARLDIGTCMRFLLES